MIKNPIFYVVLIVTILSGAFVSWYLFRFMAIVDQGVVSQGIIASTQALKYTLIDAETGERGYIITGDLRFLDPYNHSLAVIEQQLQTLNEATTTTSTLDPSAYSISVLAHEKIKELKIAITLRDEQGFDAARDYVKTYRGKQVMDDIRSIVQNVGEVEEHRVMAISIQLKDTARIIIYGDLLLLGCIIFLIIFRPTYKTPS